MANILIDQVTLIGWTGSAWQLGGRVTSDDDHRVEFSTTSASMLPATLNAALVTAAIAAVEADGAGTVGVLDAKLIVGGFVAI